MQNSRMILIYTNTGGKIPRDEIIIFADGAVTMIQRPPLNIPIPQSQVVGTEPPLRFEQ